MGLSASEIEYSQLQPLKSEDSEQCPQILEENYFQARILYSAKLLHTSIECRHFKSCKVSKYFSSSLMLLCDLLHPPKGRSKRQ